MWMYLNALKCTHTYYQDNSQKRIKNCRCKRLRKKGYWMGAPQKKRYTVISEGVLALVLVWIFVFKFSKRLEIVDMTLADIKLWCQYYTENKELRRFEDEVIQQGVIEMVLTVCQQSGFLYRF